MMRRMRSAIELRRRRERWRRGPGRGLRAWPFAHNDCRLAVGRRGSAPPGLDTRLPSGLNFSEELH